MSECSGYGGRTGIGISVDSNMLLDIFKGRVSQSDVQSDRIFSLQPHLYHVLGGAVDIEAEGAYYGGSDFGNDEQKKRNI